MLDFVAKALKTTATIPIGYVTSYGKLLKQLKRNRELLEELWLRTLFIQ